jgi:hypothetical protein
VTPVTRTGRARFMGKSHPPIQEHQMIATKLTALAATAAVALSALAPAIGQAKATGPGRYTVSKQVYVYVKPGLRFTGTMFKGNTFKVERLSKSGKWAYGMAYGHVNRHAWIDAGALRKKQ